MDLIEKKAVITCVCSNPGNRVAHKLFNSGATVYVNDHHESHGQKVVKELQNMIKESSQECSFIKLDVGVNSPDKILPEDFVEKNGPVDILINIIGCNKDDFENEIKTHNNFIHSHITKLININRAFIPTMKLPNGSKIINVVCDKSLEEDVIVYTKELANELANQKITVNCVSTGGSKSARIQDEIAEIILFMAGTATNHVTGQILHVNDGLVA